MELIPQGSETVVIVNYKDLYEYQRNFPEHFAYFEDDSEVESGDATDSDAGNDSDRELGNATDSQTVDQAPADETAAIHGYVNKIAYSFTDHGIIYLLAVSQSVFPSLRDDWEDLEIEADSYLRYDIWYGSDHYIILEDEGILVITESESAAKHVIKIYDRGTGSLADADGSDMKLLLDKLEGSPLVVALVGDDCGEYVSGCQGNGISLATSGDGLEEVIVDVVVLFNSERRADRAVHDYDDLADFISDGLEFFAEFAAEWADLASASDVDIYDLVSDGEFVTGSGIIELDN